MFIFEHEKLHVYQAAREFNRLVAALMKTIGIDKHKLVDQSVRAATSITRNIAEGAGEFSRAEKARFYRMAKRSGGEGAAALDDLVDYGLARESDITPLKQKLGEIQAMLTALIKTFELGSKPNGKRGRAQDRAASQPTRSDIPP